MGFMSPDTRDEKRKAEESRSHEHVQPPCRPVSHVYNTPIECVTKGSDFTRPSKKPIIS